MSRSGLTERLNDAAGFAPNVIAAFSKAFNTRIGAPVRRAVGVLNQNIKSARGLPLNKSLVNSAPTTAPPHSHVRANPIVTHEAHLGKK